MDLSTACTIVIQFPLSIRVEALFALGNFKLFYCLQAEEWQNKLVNNCKWCAQSAAITSNGSRVTTMAMNTDVMVVACCHSEADALP